MNLHEPADRRAEKLSETDLAAEKLAIKNSLWDNLSLAAKIPMLLRGHGRYTDDINLPGQTYAVMVRSRHAHGVIRAIDADAARKMPGVLAVYTAADLEGYGPLKCVVPLKNRDGTPMRKPWRGALAKDKVRYVGDPVACVIAETVIAAKDAAEAVEIDIETLPGRHIRRGRRARRRAAPLRRRARQRPARLSLRRRRRGRGRLRQGRARHAHEAGEQPRGRQRDGAARGGRRLRWRTALHYMSVRRALPECAPTSPTHSASTPKPCTSSPVRSAARLE